MKKVKQVYSTSPVINTETEAQIINEVKEDVAILKSLGIEAGTITQVTFIPRKTLTTFGSCHRSKVNNTFRIEINKDYIENCLVEEVHCTIMHEVIHTAPGCMNHGPEWERIADLVNKNYVFLPITMMSKYDDWSIYRAKHSKYVAMCDNCGHYFSWVRKSKKFEACWNSLARCDCGSLSFTCQIRDNPLTELPQKVTVDDVDTERSLNEMEVVGELYNRNSEKFEKVWECMDRLKWDKLLLFDTIKYFDIPEDKIEETLLSVFQIHATLNFLVKHSSNMDDANIKDVLSSLKNVLNEIESFS